MVAAPPVALAGGIQGTKAMPKQDQRPPAADIQLYDMHWDEIPEAERQQALDETVKAFGAGLVAVIGDMQANNMKVGRAVLQVFCDSDVHIRITLKRRAWGIKPRN